MLDPELQASGLAALLLEVDGETHPAAVLLHDGKVLRDDLALLVTDAGAVLQEPCSLRRVVGGYATVTTLSFAAATGLSVQSLAAGASYRLVLKSSARGGGEMAQAVIAASSVAPAPAVSVPAASSLAAVHDASDASMLPPAAKKLKARAPKVRGLYPHDEAEALAAQRLLDWHEQLSSPAQLAKTSLDLQAVNVLLTSRAVRTAVVNEGQRPGEAWQMALRCGACGDTLSTWQKCDVAKHLKRHRAPPPPPPPQPQRGTYFAGVVCMQHWSSVTPARRHAHRSCCGCSGAAIG
jgi:hypothetical protein